MVLQIDQKVDKHWPLLVVDNQGNKRKIFLEPGEMILYESAKMPHGRQIPLEGEFYDNLFVHFCIADTEEELYFQKISKFLDHHHSYSYDNEGNPYIN